MLPIEVPQFSPEYWKPLEKQLIAIANKEKRQLEPRDRVVYNVLSLAQYSAKSKRWQDVFTMLRDRGIVSLRRSHCVLLQLLTAQKMASVLKLYKPVRTRQAKAPVAKPKPTKAVKPRTRKAKRLRQRRKKGYKRRVYPVFKYGLLTLSVLTTILDFFSRCTPLGRGNPYRTPIEARLKRRSQKGYLSLRPMNNLKIGGNVRALLLDVSNGYAMRVLGGIRRHAWDGQAAKDAAAQKRKISKEILDRALNQNWQPVGAIAQKLSVLLGREVPFLEATRLLERRTNLGESFQYKGSKYPVALFSANPNAVAIEREWLTLAEAYALAKERGCPNSVNVFRKNQVYKYHKFGLEFRKEVPVYENPLLRWRSVI